MSDTNTTASAAHKQAPSEHEACAKHHTHAAACHDGNKVDEAKVSSKSAMTCFDTASMHTVTACECSTK